MNKVILVAHPDDEILWFSSQFKDANEVVVCFSDVVDNPAPGYPFIGDKRRRFFEEQPYDHFYSLDLQEPGTFGLVNSYPVLRRIKMEDLRWMTWHYLLCGLILLKPFFRKKNAQYKIPFIEMGIPNGDWNLAEGKIGIYSGVS